MVGDPDDRLPEISGRYAGVSVRDGVLELAASDIGSVEKLFYATSDTELIYVD